MLNKEFNLIQSKEIKTNMGYIYSKNDDGSFNVCFNLNTICPQPRHLHRYEASYLEQYYKLNGILRWKLD